MINFNALLCLNGQMIRLFDDWFTMLSNRSEKVTIITWFLFFGISVYPYKFKWVKLKCISYQFICFSTLLELFGICRRRKYKLVLWLPLSHLTDCFSLFHSQISLFILILDTVYTCVKFQFTSKSSGLIPDCWRCNIIPPVIMIW